jgi:dATP pyrophosphohydrolase
MLRVMRRINVLVFIFTMTPELKFLLLKRVPEKGGFWQPLSGGIELDEMPDGAVRRELYEETGIQDIVRVLKLNYSFTHDTPKNGVLMHQEDICYAVEVVGAAKIALSHEHNEYRWCSLEEVRLLLQWEPAVLVLEKLVRLLKSQHLT